jgi:hypothetical protein
MKLIILFLLPFCQSLVQKALSRQQFRLHGNGAPFTDGCEVIPQQASKDALITTVKAGLACASALLVGAATSVADETKPKKTKKPKGRFNNIDIQ